MLVDPCDFGPLHDSTFLLVPRLPAASLRQEESVVYFFFLSAFRLLPLLRALWHHPRFSGLVLATHAEPPCRRGLGPSLF